MGNAVGCVLSQVRGEKDRHDNAAKWTTSQSTLVTSLVRLGADNVNHVVSLCDVYVLNIPFQKIKYHFVCIKSF